MGIVGLVGALFHKKGHMPLEPTRQGGNNMAEMTTPVEFSGEYIFLQELLLCDETHAIKIADEFERITGQKLENAELVPTDKKSKTLCTKTADKTYYLKISSVNVLREIREDSVTGEVIFQIIY